MIIRVTTFIDLEVTDEAAAEDACNSLDLGLTAALDNFPGEVLGAEVHTYRHMTEQEIQDAGHTE